MYFNFVALQIVTDVLQLTMIPRVYLLQHITYAHVLSRKDWICLLIARVDYDVDRELQCFF